MGHCPKSTFHMHVSLPKNKEINKEIVSDSAIIALPVYPERATASRINPPISNHQNSSHSGTPSSSSSSSST